jgi:hypothetical protein
MAKVSVRVKVRVRVRARVRVKVMVRVTVIIKIRGRVQYDNVYQFMNKTFIYVRLRSTSKSLIDVQSSNRGPILKYMAVFHFLKSTSTDVTDVCFK